MMKMKLRPSLTKKMNNLTRRLNLALSVLSISLALTACGFLLAVPCTQAFAQKRGPVERIVEGQVVNKTGANLGGAVVYLKDSRSNSVKTYIADDDGHFRFGNLSQNTDYQLWADSNGVRSKSREISSFDNENNFHFTLKIDAAK
jgi:hypothetical protein